MDYNHYTMLKFTVCLLLVAPAFGQKKPITLESMNEGGRGGVPSGPGRGAGAATWAPDGKTFVFRQGRSLMIYDPATKSSKDLVAVDAMDAAAAAMNPPPNDGPFDWTNRRVRAGGLQFSSDGKELLYASGGDLFLVHVDTGKWDQLTKTPVAEVDPKLSPDGKMVVFRRGWDLYSIDVATHKETPLTTHGAETLRNGGLDWVYPEELELGTAFWWSPDSKSIAYLQFDTSREPIFPHEDLLRTRALYEPERYPQAGENNADVHLGVVAAAGGPTRWLEVGDTRNSYLIARAGWMPDSKSVYAIRTNRVQNRLEMLSIGAESGASSTIFRESDPYWINLRGDVEFLQDGKRFLWTSERDGFRHIYLYSIDGKNVRQLTKGPWEVAGVAAVNEAEAGGRVFYSSDEPTPLEHHFYSIGLDGQGKRQLSAAGYTHTISIGPGGAYYLDTWSNLGNPPRTTLHSGDGAELGVYREADRTQLEQFEILPTEIVKFNLPDGTPLYGRLIKPAGFEAGQEVSGRRHGVRRAGRGGPHPQCLGGHRHRPGAGAQGLRGLANRESRHPGARARVRDGRLPQFGRDRVGRPGSRNQVPRLPGLCRSRPHRHSRVELWRLHDAERHAQCSGCVPLRFLRSAGHQLAQLRHHLHRALHGSAVGEPGGLPEHGPAAESREPEGEAHDCAQFRG